MSTPGRHSSHVRYIVGRIIRGQPCDTRASAVEVQMRRESTHWLYSEEQSFHEWNEKPEQRSYKQNGHLSEPEWIFKVSLWTNFRRGQRNEFGFDLSSK